MSQPITSPESSKILKASIWVAIGALIACALVCVVWVLVGDDSGIIGKAFLTVLLLASFAGVSILESSLAARRPAWLALAAMISWVVLLLIGAVLIWMPTSPWSWGGDRFFRFIVIGLIVQGALLHARLFIAAYQRRQTTFTSIVAYVTVGFVVILAAMLVIPLISREFVEFRPIYWRVVVALAILAAVGTALVPLVNALFAPKRLQNAQHPLPGVPHPYQAPAPSWPTYADGVTPLPVMPDGAPDWNAYYTGHASYPQPAAPVAAPLAAGEQTPPAQPGYRGFPPPPPVPPQN